MNQHQTVKQAIDEIVQLENLTYDLHGLTKSVAAMFESKVELSEEIAPKPFGGMIDQQAIESLTFLIQRSADVATELNGKLHDAIARLPHDQFRKNRTSRSSFEHEANVFHLCLAVRTLSSVIADQLAHPQGEAVTGDYGLMVAPYHIDAGMLRYAADHAAELALEVMDGHLKQ